MHRSPNSLLVDSAVALAEAETGSWPSLSGRGRVGIPTVGVKRLVGPRGRRWTPEDDDFLRRRVGWMAEPEIARRLGRTVTAVHLRRERDLHLPCPRRHPEWLTLEQVAVGLGIDSHSAAALADRGILPARTLPAVAKMRVVDKQAALDWIADPLHWLYFHPERVGQFKPQGQRHMGRPDVVFWRHARKAVDERRKTWKDAWLRPPVAAQLIGLPSRGGEKQTSLNKAIRMHLLSAARWGNWWILRSDALRFARERVVKGWGKRKISWIRFSDKPRMIYLRTLTKKERAAFDKRRLKSEFFQAKHRRNRMIRRLLKDGWPPETLAKVYVLCVPMIKLIGKEWMSRAGIHR